MPLEVCFEGRGGCYGLSQLNVYPYRRVIFDRYPPSSILSDHRSLFYIFCARQDVLGRLKAELVRRGRLDASADLEPLPLALKLIDEYIRCATRLFQ